MLTHKSFKYRLYPNNKQKEYFSKCFGCARFIYNRILEDKIEYYKENKKQKRFSQGIYKQKYLFLKEADSNALSNAQINVEKAFSNFLNSKHYCYPKFKSKKASKQTYTTNNNIKKNNIRIVDGKIRLPKVGFVNIRYHRQIPNDSIIKSVTITKYNDDTYYVSILVEYESCETNKHLDINNSISLDYSCKFLYVDSQNNIANYPKYYYAYQDKLSIAQKRLSIMTKGSSNYRKQKMKIAKIYRKIVNQRCDYLHKLSTKLANRYDIISIEDLDMIEISKSMNLGKTTMDNGYGLFQKMLIYKMNERGKILIKINKYYPSSKKCYCCGYINTMLSINDRDWICPKCGAHHLRDFNASLNINKEGTRIFSKKYVC